ncbi:MULTISPECIES: hypothetical protein [Chryseobacterium]|uniref:Uncharacterized protein n=1 Tax=Chryseobacterium gambrini TaxID=373672 RepID=A0A1N7JTD6_9FLAO|nr:MULTISPECIES: hypothetical protein [Chryseobacterium]MCY1662068.1 hypothetical protein [Chryseobacterium sp. SL1]WBV53398.1 hypothetical protein PFY09_03555 [Chryseobacterium gambrini]SIS52575.1 hypothetical protein SAMN05421785_10193 [Chryseobacterium gambrini]
MTNEHEQKLNKLFKLLDGKTTFYVRDYYKELAINPENIDDIKVIENTINLGLRYDYFIRKGEGYYDITKFGLEAIKSGDHSIYQRKILWESKKWNLITIIISIIALIISAIQLFKDSNSSEIENLKKELSENNKQLKILKTLIKTEQLNVKNSEKRIQTLENK